MRLKLIYVGNNSVSDRVYKCSRRVNLILIYLHFTCKQHFLSLFINNYKLRYVLRYVQNNFQALEIKRIKRNPYFLNISLVIFLFVYMFGLI